MLLTVSFALAACPTDLEQARRAVREALVAEPAAFAGLRDSALEAAGCLTEVAPPAYAAEVYQLVAIDAYVRRDLDTARRALGAAARTDPEGRLPPSVAPEGHLLLRLTTEGASLPDPREPLQVPTGVVPWVDGRVSTLFPTDRPALVQWLDAEGHVERTQLVLDGGLPAPPLPPAPTPLPPAPTPRSRVGRDVLLVGTAATGVAGVALLVAGLGVKGAMEAEAESSSWNPADPDTVERVERAQGTANGLGYAGQASLGVCIGLGVATVVLSF